MYFGINYYKKLAKLKYRDKILSLHGQGKSVRQITKYINSCLKKSSLKDYKLSKSTIHNLIKRR